MSESTILSSPFLNVRVVERALESTPPSDLHRRAQLLSAKILALERDASLGASERAHAIAQTGVQRAELLLAMGEDTQAEAELAVLLQSRAMRVPWGPEAAGGGKDEAERTRALRIRALQLMESVNERMGRTGRVGVWRAQRAKLEAEAG